MFLLVIFKLIAYKINYVDVQCVLVTTFYATMSNSKKSFCPSGTQKLQFLATTSDENIFLAQSNCFQIDMTQSHCTNRHEGDVLH